MQGRTRFRAVVGLVVVMALGAMTGPLTASAAGRGYGDVSDAMIYGATGPVGSLITSLARRDDRDNTVAAAFPLNFFGTRAEALCITTNGTIVPVATISDTCSHEYDHDLNNIARDSNASVIAALALDLDGGNDIWKPGVNIVSMQRVSNNVTVTTDAPHNLVLNDDALIWTPYGTPEWQNDRSRAVTSIPSPTTFVFSETGSDVTVNPVGGTVSPGYYRDNVDDSNADGFADDGFGDVGSVYYGTTTIDGKQAMVVTWYRTPSHDDDNNPQLTHTFQIVLIDDGGSSTTGSDFTIQYNYGTSQDAEDGYNASTPSSECDGDPQYPARNVECRWGVGWVQLVGAGPSATTDVYDLYPNRQISTLVDQAGASSIVQNRLNSDVRGRYTWRMVDGRTVGFARPAMDGLDYGTLPRPQAVSQAAVTESQSASAPKLPDTGFDGAAGLAAGAAFLLGGLALGAVALRRRRVS